jgi:hypothetical protein
MQCSSRARMECMLRQVRPLAQNARLMQQEYKTMWQAGRNVLASPSTKLAGLPSEAWYLILKCCSAGV